MAGEGEEISVNIRAPRSTFDVPASVHMFVAQLKFRIAPKCGIHERHQRMIYRKKIMDDTRTLGSYGVTYETPVFVLNMLGPDPDMQQRELDDMQEQLGDLLDDPVHIRYLFYIPEIQNLFDQNDDSAMWVCFSLMGGNRVINYVDVEHIRNNPATLRIILDAAYNISTMHKMLRATLVRKTTDPVNRASSRGYHDPSVPKLIEAMGRYPDSLIECLSVTPRLRNMLDSTSWFRGMTGNPEFIHRFAIPPIAHAILILQKALWRQAVVDAINRYTGWTGQVTAAETLQRVIAMFRDLAGTAEIVLETARADPVIQLTEDLGECGPENTVNSPGTPNTIPLPNPWAYTPGKSQFIHMLEYYATQLARLYEPGFPDILENIRELRAPTASNAQLAFESLLTLAYGNIHNRLRQLGILSPDVIAPALIAMAGNAQSTIRTIPDLDAYAILLDDLHQLGLIGSEQSIRALIDAGGNVSRALRSILYSESSESSETEHTMLYEQTIDELAGLSIDTGRTDRQLQQQGGRGPENTMAGVLDLEGLPASILDIVDAEHREDRMVQETIHLMLVEPQYLIQFFSITQRLRNVLDSNPQIRDVMANPEFVHQLATPEIVNALLIYRSALEDQLYLDEETAEKILQRLCDLFVELAIRSGMIPAIARADPP